MLSARQWLAALAFAALAAIGARLTLPVPGADVPQTAQTVAILLAGALGGFRVGVVAVFLYLAAGVAGVPVFADGDAGPRVLFGPSGGYLLGFLLAAAGLGMLRDANRLGRGLIPTLLAMIAAHAMILATGGAFLVISIGAAAAWFNGVEPFLLGALVKSVLAGAVVLLVRSQRSRHAA